jgi:uncharacterized protein YceK
MKLTYVFVVILLLSGCSSFGSNESPSAKQETADCQRRSSTDRECDSAKTAEGSGAVAPVAPH